MPSKCPKKCMVVVLDDWVWSARTHGDALPTSWGISNIRTSDSWRHRFSCVFTMFTFIWEKSCFDLHDILFDSVATGQGSSIRPSANLRIAVCNYRRIDPDTAQLTSFVRAGHPVDIRSQSGVENKGEDLSPDFSCAGSWNCVETRSTVRTWLELG